MLRAVPVAFHLYIYWRTRGSSSIIHDSAVAALVDLAGKYDFCITRIVDFGRIH